MHPSLNFIKSESKRRVFVVVINLHSTPFRFHLYISSEFHHVPYSNRKISAFMQCFFFDYKILNYNETILQTE